MMFNMRRSLVWIRSNADIPFHTEIDPTWFNRIKETTIEFSENCQVDLEYIDNKFLKINFWLPNYEDFFNMTNCFYEKGKIKPIFKEAMSYAKSNNIAFALSSRWINKTSSSNYYVKDWFCDKKITSDSKLLEEIKSTLRHRIYSVNAFLNLNNCVMTSTVYNYTHDVKHTYYLFLEKNQETIEEINKIKNDAFLAYHPWRQQHNLRHNIESIADSMSSELLPYHDFNGIPSDFFPDNNFLNLRIPI